MAKIKIKNFGPIKDGFKEILADGTVNEWIDVKKVSVFIGNQGSGKSTVAKLISVFMWLEKASIRGDIHTPDKNNDFFDLLGFHGIANYFNESTKIEYEGESYRFIMIKGLKPSKAIINAEPLGNINIFQPKIMYVPAERNFLSSIPNINKVSDIMVGSLKNYAVEFRNAQLALRNKSFELPINNSRVFYDPIEDENYISFSDKKLKLAESSSGFHSVVPLLWVTKYLTEYLQLDERILLEMLSTDQTIRRNKELRTLNNELISESMLKEKEQAINDKYVSKYLVNIVEEPEQNLFPTSQRSVLYSLLEYNNLNEDNKLIMTTHSPYLISYLTHAVKASKVLEKINKSNNKAELRMKLQEIVPIHSVVGADDWVVYELNETDGSILKLKDYKGLPSDSNYLNEKMAEGNEIFGNLLDVEDLCQ